VKGPDWYWQPFGSQITHTVVSRLHRTSEQPIALMTDGAESLLRLRSFLPVPTRFVLNYFHVSMKLRHLDQTKSAGA
jgi:hypothetical protein